MFKHFQNITKTPAGSLYLTQRTSATFTTKHHMTHTQPELSSLFTVQYTISGMQLCVRVYTVTLGLHTFCERHLYWCQVSGSFIGPLSLVVEDILKLLKLFTEPILDL